MKSLFALSLTLLLSLPAHGLPLGNPSDASLLHEGLFREGVCAEFGFSEICWCDGFDVRFGYYGDFVFNRHLEVNDSSTKGQIERSRLFTNAGYLVFNAFDKVDLFATFGGTNFTLETNASSFGVPGTLRFELETESDFSWSIGGRATLLTCGCAQFGLIAHYFATRPDIKRISLAKTLAIYPDSTLTLYYQEWQIGAGLSYPIRCFIPYIGFKGGAARASFGDATFLLGPNLVTLRHLQNRFSTGFAIGVSLTSYEKISLTVEARFPDEKALYVNGQIRY